MPIASALQASSGSRARLATSLALILPWAGYSGSGVAPVAALVFISQGLSTNASFRKGFAWRFAWGFLALRLRGVASSAVWRSVGSEILGLLRLPAALCCSCRRLRVLVENLQVAARLTLGPALRYKLRLVRHFCPNCGRLEAMAKGGHLQQSSRGGAFLWRCVSVSFMVGAKWAFWGRFWRSVVARLRGKGTR